MQCPRIKAQIAARLLILLNAATQDAWLHKFLAVLQSDSCFELYGKVDVLCNGQALL